MNDSVIRTAFKTDIGRRKENEDSCLVLNGSELAGHADGLLIVADGMGGRASGQVASSMAVASVRDTFMARMPAPDLSQALGESLRAANAAVYREASSKPELQGMGTTCVVAAINGDCAHFAHLGDSRIYLLRDGHIKRLTDDHSFVAEKVRSGEITEEQARRSRFRNIITRAIGLEPDTQPSVGSVELEQGDVLLLCSDGLSGPVSDNQIADILCSSSDPDEACSRLVNAALRNGGSDNITVALAAYGVSSKTVRRREPLRSGRPVSRVIPALIGLLLGIGIGLYPGYLMFRNLPEQPEQPVLNVPSMTDLNYSLPAQLTYEPLQPGFLALDSDGRLHVVDTKGRRMMVDKTGKVLASFPERDTFRPLEHQPSRMCAADKQGNLYVSDPVGGKIMKFGRDGRFLRAIGEGALTSPEALAIGPDGSIYTIDDGRLKALRVEPPKNTDGTDAGG